MTRTLLRYSALKAVAQFWGVIALFCCLAAILVWGVLRFGAIAFVVMIVLVVVTASVDIYRSEP